MRRWHDIFHDLLYNIIDGIAWGCGFVFTIWILAKILS